MASRTSPESKKRWRPRRASAMGKMPPKPRKNSLLMIYRTIYRNNDRCQEQSEVAGLTMASKRGILRARLLRELDETSSLNRSCRVRSAVRRGHVFPTTARLLVVPEDQAANAARNPESSVGADAGRRLHIVEARSQRHPALAGSG